MEVKDVIATLKNANIVIEVVKSETEWEVKHFGMETNVPKTLLNKEVIELYQFVLNDMPMLQITVKE